MLLPTPHAQNVPRDGRSPPPLAPRAFFMLSQRSNGEPCPPSGRLRGFRGMEMARHLTSLLERSSWPGVSRSAEACLASGVPGSSVSTSPPPHSPPIPAPDVPGYNSRAFVHTFALAVRNINAQVDLQLSAAHQCRLAC